MDQTEYQTPTKLFAEMEAPFSYSVKLLHRGYDGMLTIRAATGQQLFELVNNALDVLEFDGATPLTHGPQNVGAAKPPASGGQEPAQTQQPAPSGSGAAGIIPCSYFTIETDVESGKLVVKFRNMGREWPEITMKAPKARVEAVLGHLVEDATATAKYEIPVLVHWVQGNAYVKRDGTTDHYKNVVKVEDARQ